MKRHLSTLALTIALAACVDTTGLSPESSRVPKGNPNSSVVVAEFADLQCPACRAATAINEVLLQKYGSQVRFEFHHFPLRNIHRYALDLAEGAECAADQGKFWEFIDIAFERQPQLEKGSVDEWAAELGLDMDLFGRCAESHIKRDMVMADYDEGRAAGVTGTPTYFVNGKKVPSTVDDISKAIDEAMQGAMQRL